MEKKKHSALKIVLPAVIVLVLLALTGAVWGFLHAENERKHLEEITPVCADAVLEAEAFDALPPPERYFDYLGALDLSTVRMHYADRATGTRIMPGEDEGLPVGTYDVLIGTDFRDEPYTGTLKVVDTTPPVLTLKEVSVEYGEAFEEADFIENCADGSGNSFDFTFAYQNADGETVDLPSPEDSGVYAVTVTAKDPSGNTASGETKLTIADEPEPEPEPEPVPAPEPEPVPAPEPAPAPEPQPEPSNKTPVPTGSTPYSIMVNRRMNTVTVYRKNDDGGYDPYTAFVCSTGGSNTPLGSFNLGQKYRWLRLVGGVYGQYTMRIHGSIAFHSVPYFSQSISDLEYLEYNKLGKAASLGCVRMCVRDVKWIYDHCKAGTPVTIYDADDPGPLGKPTGIKIDPDSPNRGWDPTDPDPENPWNQPEEPDESEASSESASDGSSEESEASSESASDGSSEESEASSESASEESSGENEE